MQDFAYFCIQIVMKLKIKVILYALLLLMLSSCGWHKDNDAMQAPWGESPDTIAATTFDLGFIQASGEMIMLTISGPESYYDYQGREFGLQYLLCQKFAQSIGVRLRVDVCRDTTDLISKLLAGEGDVAAYMIDADNAQAGQLLFCGPRIDSLSQQWAVGADKPLLAEAIGNWYKPSMWDRVKKEENYLLSHRSIKRRVYSPMLNRSAGIISKYDGLFVKYSRQIGWDWRLMAAQCYQESTFDPKAKSWAGACGLMQIMPSTADILGLPQSKIYDPESNIVAAAKYLAQLEGKFRDVSSRNERLNFVLASYNGGIHHVRDAMALAKHHGKNTMRWRDVEPYILMLATPEGYKHPVVKHGYMRGSETAGYVAKIRERWKSYCGVKSLRGVQMNMKPERAKTKKKKFDIDQGK